MTERAKTQCTTARFFAQFECRGGLPRPPFFRAQKTAPVGAGTTARDVLSPFATGEADKYALVENAAPGVHFGRVLIFT